MEHGILTDIGLSIIAAAVLGMAGRRIGLTPMVAYLAAGFLIGPHLLGWVTEAHNIETISHLGLSLLLFLIGLEMDLKKMLQAGRLITLTAAVQIVGGCLAAFGLFWWLPFPHTQTVLPVIYLAVAATLASTVIVVKTLHDQQEIDTLPGRITVGILVLQDLLAIVFLAVQPNLAAPSPGPILLSLGKVVVLVAVGFLCSRYVLPTVFHRVALSPELVLVGALAWCFAMAALASALELSREMGALIAGVALSTFPYAVDLCGRVTSLRDFFLVLFFVALGMLMPLPGWEHLAWGLVFGLVLIATRLLTVFPPLYSMKQGLRASLMPAINLCQLSELSLVIVALGVAAGHLEEGLSTIVAVAFAVLAVDSGFVLARNHQIADWAAPWLKRAGLRDLEAGTMPTAFGDRPPRIYLLGFYRTASSLLDHLERTDSTLLRDLLVVDLNPNVYAALKQRGIRVKYGDITKRETLEHVGLAQARTIVCTLPDSILRGGNNRTLLHWLRQLNPTAQIIMPAESAKGATALYQAGASYVYLPRTLEASHVLAAMRTADQDLLGEQRREHLEELAARHEVLP